MLQGGKSGPAIVPGKPEESLIIAKIRSGEMPPRTRLVEVSIKPIEPAEIELVARWIEQGTPELEVVPDVTSTGPDPLVTDADRSFWSFRQPQPVQPPIVRGAARVRNPIDAFVLERLEPKGLSLAAEADRPTLMRRAFLDLTGLPPQPGEVQEFLNDPDPQAYERMIDRLLASPRYGERWARHWLDVAGYADSEGKREQDLPRPFAYRYRDYVIRSLNADKPYDRFLLEQLAGDELFDYEHAPEITGEIYDSLVATGFLRMAPDGTWANITGFIPDRLEVISDEIEILGSGVMGLTLKCARCHDHKFDPIPQHDYYRLVDVFKGAYDEHDWLKPEISTLPAPISMDPNGDRHLPYVTTAERQQWERHDDGIARAVESLRTMLDRQAESLTRRYLDERLAQLPEVLREDVRQMLATPADQRTEVQKYLAEKFGKTLRIDRDELKRIDADFKKQSADTEERIKGLEARRLPEPKIRALWDRGEPSPTYILRRGDYLTPGRLVRPGVPSVLADRSTRFEVKPPWPGAKSTGRRLAFARWLTRPDHPLTARVMVNRIWRHHFGTGIVKTLGNFGKTGASPTHPELLDWLALEFVRQGWSIKAMHRLMMTSSTYRQASGVTPAQEELDPNNLLYSRMPIERVDAETLYDTMLAASARLDPTPFGRPDPVETRKDGLVTPGTTGSGWRRSVYVQQARKQIPTILENFDLPQMNPNCLERTVSNVATQALHLMNDAMVHKLAEHFAGRVEVEVGDDPAKQIEWVYLVSLSRPPTGEEKEIGLAALAQLTDQWARHLTASGQPDNALATPREAARRALSSFCHTMMNSAEFIFVD
jgi:hypothetical protein